MFCPILSVNIAPDKTNKINNTMKTTEFTPGKIVYRVDVYEKNQLGQFKGYFDNYMSALFESEHDIIVSELQEMQAHTQVTMCYIEKTGEIKQQEIYYFI